MIHKIKIFFFINKKQCIDQKRSKVPRSTSGVNKRELEGKQETAEQAAAKTYQPKNQGPSSQKTSPAPQLEANHSKKPISEEILSHMYKLFQLHKLETKECFSFYTSTIPSLKAMRLRSFHTVQKMHRGT